MVAEPQRLGPRPGAVLLDLGGTLAHYFDRAEFPAVLEQAIRAVQDHLRARGRLLVSEPAMWAAVRDEDHEAPDHHVRPLEGRLARIFALAELRSADERSSADEVLGLAGDLDQPGHWAGLLCRAFLRPIFRRGRLYDDALPVLRKLRAAGLRTAIVSNTPWGSPAGPWREEIERLGLRHWVDATVFCRDVGWRKPARPIFDHALARLQAAAGDCVFVGDHATWDVAGPQAAGIEAILIDRAGTLGDSGHNPIRSLHELEARLGIQT